MPNVKLWSTFCKNINTDEVEKGSVLEQQMEQLRQAKEERLSQMKSSPKPKVIAAATAGFQRLQSSF